MLVKGELKTLKDVITSKCEQYKDNTCFLEKDKTTKKFREVKYHQLKTDVIGLATILKNKFNLLNQKVAVIGENSYKWFVTYMAVTTGTGVIVPLDKELPKEEILNLIKRADVKCLVYSSKKKKLVEELKEELSQIILVEMDKDDKTIKEKEDVYSYESLLQEGIVQVNNGDNWYYENNIDENEMRLLMFTSGTTATSKGVMLCHRNVISNLDGALDLMKVDVNDRFFSVLPMHHIYEMVVTCIYAVANGSSIAICQGLKYISQDIKETNPTVLVCVPLLIEHVCKKINKKLKASHKEIIVKALSKITNLLGKNKLKVKKKVFKEIHDSLGGRLKYILVSAAPIEKKIINQIEGYGFVVYQGYGLTETASVVSGTREYDKNRTGTVGTPTNCQVKIEKTSDASDGEILVRGNNVMLGYYQDELATREAITEGWFHTGDLAHYDKNGNIVITGRCKNVIVTNNGKNIYPEELENEINKIDLVKESMVYGEGLGTYLSICAVVTLDEEELKNAFECENPNNEDIKKRIWKHIKSINSKMVAYKAVKMIKIRRKDFIKTTTLKIKRFAKENRSGY